MRPDSRQSELPFSEAEGSYEERRMRFEIVLNELLDQAPQRQRLCLQQLARFIFHTCEKTGRAVTESQVALGKRFFKSHDTITRHLARLHHHGLVAIRTRQAESGASLTNELWSPYSRLSFCGPPAQDRPAPLRTPRVPPTHAAAPPLRMLHPSPTHAAPGVSGGDIRACARHRLSSSGMVSAAPSDDEPDDDRRDGDEDGARDFALGAIEEIREKANRLAAAVRRMPAPEDRELVLKVATLWHDGTLREDQVEQVLESFALADEQGKVIDRRIGWLWTGLKNQCLKHNQHFERLLAECVFPAELLSPAAREPRDFVHVEQHR